MYPVDSTSRLAAKIQGRADIPKQRFALLHHAVETTRHDNTVAMIGREEMGRAAEALAVSGADSPVQSRISFSIEIGYTSIGWTDD
jgi:hypothetical protein